MAMNGHESVQPQMEQQGFSAEQLELLKAQIMAFKLISSNVPLPNYLQEKLQTVETGHDSSNVSSCQDVKPKLENTPSFMAEQDALGSAHALPPLSSNMHAIPPGSSVALKLLYSILHAPQQMAQTQTTAATTPTGAAAGKTPQSSVPPVPPMTLFPMVVPEAMDPVHVAEERSKLIAARMGERIRQLENLPDTLPDSLRLKALIELKGLRVFEHQKRLRADILANMQKITTSTTLLDAASFRRHKRSTLRTTRMNERQERQQKVDKSRKERQKHQEFLNAIVERTKEFQSFHRAYQQQKLNKLAKSVLHVHAQYEKEEIRRLDKLAKDRITALKADDEEAYLKLIDQQKDTRLTHLIRQTDLYLESLTSRVLAQQQDATLRGPESSLAVEEQFEFDEPGPGSKADYYATAHKISETVVRQPQMLVGGKLKEYQMKGLQWMTSLYNNRLNGILADEMGLGKTIQTIALISHLLETKNQNGPYLVIVPLSTMTNWAMEFEKWAPSIVKVEYKGTPYVRKTIQAEFKHVRFNVMLTTYEYIIKDKAFLSKIKWLYMIIDEGHRMKNANSKLTNVLTSYYSARYRLILTGTPLQNNLPELWALLNFILPKIFNSSRGFDEWFNAPFANTGERFELNEEETLLIIRRLHKVLRPFLLRRLKKDVESELPDKVERIIKCPLSALQSKLYTLIKEKSRMLADPTRSAGSVGIRRFNNTIMQLRKICNHPFVFEEVERQINPMKINNDLLYRVSGKFELLKRILPKFKATGHRVLMFFQMTMVMTVMEDFLTMLGYQYMRLDGSTKAEDRSAMLKEFNAANSPYFIFLLSTRAGGLGLNLQSADTVIIFDSDWNPHQDLQAQDRAHRIGQTKEVRIFRLITVDSVEEMILARAQFKLNLDGKVIQAGKFDHKSTNEEREALLRAILETEQGKEDEDNENEVFDDEELNELISRSESELELFRSMDEEAKKEEVKRTQLAAKKGIKWSRLIDLSELPAVYLNDNYGIEDEDTVELGRGARPRKALAYDDGLSDDKWLDQLERNAADSQSEEQTPVVMERKRGRPPSSATKKAATADKLPPLLRETTSDSEEGDESRQPPSKRTMVVGKRGRGAGAAAVSMPDPLSPGSRARLQRACYRLFAKLENATDENGRSLSVMFAKLPSKALYPDYFSSIAKPISLKMIQKKMDGKNYVALQDMKEDLLLLTNNAMSYNMEGSVIYQDAAALKEMIMEWDMDMESMTNESGNEEDHHAELSEEQDRSKRDNDSGSATEQENSNGNESGAEDASMSEADSPQKPVPKFTIKLQKSK